MIKAKTFLIVLISFSLLGYAQIIDNNELCHEFISQLDIPKNKMYLRECRTNESSQYKVRVIYSVYKQDIVSVANSLSNNYNLLINKNSRSVEKQGTRVENVNEIWHGHGIKFLNNDGRAFIAIEVAEITNLASYNKENKDFFVEFLWFPDGV